VASTWEQSPECNGVAGELLAHQLQDVVLSQPTAELGGEEAAAPAPAAAP
jgi:hypothetical protein